MDPSTDDRPKSYVSKNLLRNNQDRKVFPCQNLSKIERNRSLYHWIDCARCQGVWLAFILFKNGLPLCSQIGRRNPLAGKIERSKLTVKSDGQIVRPNRTVKSDGHIGRSNCTVRLVDQIGRPDWLVKSDEPNYEQFPGEGGTIFVEIMKSKKKYFSNFSNTFKIRFVPNHFCFRFFSNNWRRKNFHFYLLNVMR